VLECPRCHGRLKIIAFITELAVVHKILAHLRLPTELPEPLPARLPPQLELELDAELPADNEAEGDSASGSAPLYLRGPPRS